MLFNSWQFAVFFPLVTAGYFALPHRFRWLWLLLASCVFYMAFVPAYILILAVTIAIDYTAGLAIARSEGKAKKRWLYGSLAANLGMLGFFKYFNFFNANVAALAGLVHWNYPIQALSILLPIGLSFHVFQSLSYTIEVYRGNQAPEKHLGIFALYVMFYPQLVAGPIERPQNLLHQFHEEHTFDYRRVVDGLLRMTWGLFKKTVIADRIALLVDPVFAHPHDHTGLTLIAAVVLYAFQIYCDFSGYSDIALGAAQVMGFRLMENFQTPYFSRSIAEFWRRWHVSLSSWFNDYVFMPLSFAFKERGRAGAALAAILTFAASGLWHGAAWTFVVWGALHGGAIATELLTRKRRKAVAAKVPAPLYAAVAWAATFGFVCFAYIFFRMPTLAGAWYVASHLGTGLASQLASPAAVAASLAPLDPTFVQLAIVAMAIAVMQLAEGTTKTGPAPARLAAQPVWLRWAAYQALALSLLMLGVYKNHAFIYFQF